MDNQHTTSNPSSQKLNAEIRKTWGKLTDEEISFYEGKRDKFFEAVKIKYSVNKDDAEKTMRKLEAECSTTSGKDSNAASGPTTAKAANDSNATAVPVAKAANA
jgi:uncharacterized protein YjbJ (UPF0337 family)